MNRWTEPSSAGLHKHRINNQTRSKLTGIMAGTKAEDLRGRRSFTPLGNDLLYRMGEGQNQYNGLNAFSVSGHGCGMELSLSILSIYQPEHPAACPKLLDPVFSGDLSMAISQAFVSTHSNETFWWHPSPLLDLNNNKSTPGNTYLIQDISIMVVLSACPAVKRLTSGFHFSDEQLLSFLK